MAANILFVRVTRGVLADEVACPWIRQDGDQFQSVTKCCVKFVKVVVRVAVEHTKYKP